MTFGDVKRDHTENSIISLSEFKNSRTLFPYGIKIERLVDTLYFAHSHHSRFIQLADVLMFFVQLSHYSDQSKYMDKEVLSAFHSTPIMTTCRKKPWP